MNQKSLPTILPALGFLLLLWNTPGFSQDTLPVPPVQPGLSGVLLAQAVDVRREESGGLTIHRRDEQGDVQRTAPTRFQPIVPPLEQTRDGGRMLEAGWDAFGLGAHDQALAFFEEAAGLFPPGNQRNEAALGRAYALTALERHDQAVSVLEGLLQAGYRPNEVRAALFRALMQADQLERAEAVLAGLDDEHQQDLRRQEIQRLRFEQDLSAALQARQTQPLQDFLDTHRAWLDQCREPYAFFQASQALREQGARGTAREVARKLLSCPLQGREQGLFVPLLQRVITGLPFDQAQREIARQRKQMQGRDAALAELARLELELFQRRIADLSPDDPEYARLAEQILRLAPDDDALRLIMAWNCFETRDDTCAEELFRDVHRRTPANVSALEGLVALLERQGRTDEAISLAEGAPSSELFLPVLTRLYRAEAARFFSAEDHPRTLHWLDRHAAIAPDDADDPELLALRSWALFHSDRHEQALDVFATRLARGGPEAPEEEDALMGMVASLQALGRGQEAIPLLEARREQLTAELRNVLGTLYCTLGNEEFTAGSLDQAVVYLRHCVDLTPDIGAVQLLGWSLYQLGDPQGAHDHFLEAFAQQPDQETAEAVLTNARELDNRTAFWTLLEEMAGHVSPHVRTAAADAYATEELPILAAQTHPESGRGTCYANCDSPWLDTGVQYRGVTGDRGLSRLNELSFPVQYHSPAAHGGKWSLRVTPRLLNTDKAPQDAYMGSFYSFLDQDRQRQSPLDQVWVVAPEVVYQREGRHRFEAMLGATSLGGPIHALPIFHLGLGQENDWSLELRQGSVSDSLLSSIGQKDPYSQATWGRVVHSGLKTRKTFDLTTSYWLAAEAEYDYYWGENVAENHSVAGNLSLGRTDDLRGMALTSGLSLTAFHFQNNQNFHTFGHGGYFSPDHFVVAGPFVRLQSPRCKGYWFDLYASLGWMDYVSEEAPHYRKISGAAPETMNTAARNDFQGKYPKESKSALAAAMNLQAMKLITKNWSFGATAGINNASDHTQWQAGLLLQYLFEPREAFFSRGDF
ncbi:cellulose synthase subunit BcsC-related outer membrane protein [Desulfonatronum sp. SC1]|uniref:cellulose synthase subunit BcsC-related outer membrane protein n=1 Tax=Desulfonatronum sp. SC1 TaxID=2109626 RepID=UPI0011B241CF|nr:cellulose synthase subunit BcsC-related outer membrane protein [Desulfonatronum sp. SC1]